MEEATPSSSSNEGFITALDVVQAVHQKQLDLVLAENDKLKAANDVLGKELEAREKVIEEREIEICDLGRRNEGLSTIVRRYRAQYHKTCDSLLKQPLSNPPSASAPPAARYQEAEHRRASLTYTLSSTEAPPTEPRLLAGVLDGTSSAVLGTQAHETDHAFRVKGHRSFAGPYPSIQGTSIFPLSDEENSPHDVLAAEPTQTQSQLGASVDEGDVLSPLETEISLTISDDMEY